MSESKRAPFDGRPIRNSASRFKGVVKNEGPKAWRAMFTLAKRKPILIGRFDTEEQAAQAYDTYALAQRGPSAFLNFRDLGPKTDPIVEGDIAKVPLSPKGHLTIDLEDLPTVGQYYWNHSHEHVSGTKDQRNVTLTTLLLGALPKNHVATHINGDKLDFRKDNLAIVPWKLHFGRHRKAKNCRSIYKGVKRRSRNSWHARLLGRHLGAFRNEIDAALAYDEAARKQYGLFAALNFPCEGETSALRDPAEKKAA